MDKFSNCPVFAGVVGPEIAQLEQCVQVQIGGGTNENGCRVAPHTPVFYIDTTQSENELFVPRVAPDDVTACAGNFGWDESGGAKKINFGGKSRFMGIALAEIDNADEAHTNLSAMARISVQRHGIATVFINTSTKVAGARKDINLIEYGDVVAVSHSEAANNCARIAMTHANLTPCSVVVIPRARYIATNPVACTVIGDVVSVGSDTEHFVRVNLRA